MLIEDKSQQRVCNSSDTALTDANIGQAYFWGASSAMARARQIEILLAERRQASPALCAREGGAPGGAIFPTTTTSLHICNLFCEGCYYFEGEDYKQAKEESNLLKWRALFKAEAEKGVTFANFVGAEPSLEQRRVALALDYFKRGVVFTNGTVEARTYYHQLCRHDLNMG